MATVRVWCDQHLRTGYVLTFENATVKRIHGGYKLRIRQVGRETVINSWSRYEVEQDGAAV